MMRIPTHAFCFVAASLALAGATYEASAADHGAALAPFLNDDVFAVGYVDVAALHVTDGEIQKWLSSLAGDSQAAALAVGGVTNAIQGIQAAGVEGVYAVLSVDNVFPDHGPLLVVRLTAGADPQAVENRLRGLAQGASAASDAAPGFRVRQYAPRMLIVGAELSVNRSESMVASERKDLIEPLARMSDAGAELAVVFSPGPDFRRVVRELWPELPPPMTPMRGELADRWLRLEFEAKTQAEPTARLAMQATDRESAVLFVQLLHDLPEASEQIPELGKRRQELRRVLQTIVDAVPTRVDDARVVMTLPTDETQIAKLRGLVSDAGDSAMESTRRHERMNQFKQIALAMHIYADKYKHLPPASIRDADGRPLLSWRVAVLPYVDQADLFNQFHLDEPWDSSHNRALVERMPDVFADPSPKIRRSAGMGKTTFVVPAGPGTVFDGPEGKTFKELTDGTSKTIMLVEVPPHGAVVWTKPEDWDVDLEQPWEGLKRTNRDYITAAWFDGRVSIIQTDVDPVKLRAVLTRAGKEPVDFPW